MKIKQVMQREVITARHITASRPETRVLFMSKPFTPGELTRRVRQVLDDK